MRLQRQPDCREGRPGETFWRRRYEGSIYAHFPNLGEGATEEQKTWQSEFFKQMGCDARKEVPQKNLYGKVKNDDYLTYAFRVNKYNLTKVAKAWKSNMQKIKKRKDENPHAVIKPFNLSYRKFSQPSVINLPKEEVLTRGLCRQKRKQGQYE
jgi:hypothetical protein